MAANPKGEPGYETASAIARYLAGVIFLVFGLNGFLNFIPLPLGRHCGTVHGRTVRIALPVVIFAFQVVAAYFCWPTVTCARGRRAGAGDRQHSCFPRLDGPSGLPVALFVAVLWR